jgi:ABC-type phosphate/phosphonate transport system ATPase subunit
MAVTAVNEVSLTVNDGEFVALVGLQAAARQRPSISQG